MSESNQSVPPSSSSPAEVSSTTVKPPVEIILTPPTPVTPASDLDCRLGDTHKEVLPAVSEEKEVVERTDFSDEKQVYNPNEGHDEKEVYIPEAEKEVYDHGIDKEVLDMRLHDGHDEKEFYDPKAQSPQSPDLHSSEKEVLPPYQNGEPVKEFNNLKQPAQSPPTEETKDESMAIQKYNSNPNGRKDSVSTVSTEGSEKKGNPAQCFYQRRLDKLNQAVDKKKKAWTAFTNDSSTAMAEKKKAFTNYTNESSTAMAQKYNKMGEGLKDRRTAFEKGTMTKLDQWDKGINDSVNRAGKNVNTKVANFKQGITNVKSQSVNGVKNLGSRHQIGGKEGKADAKKEENP
ncbi:hypothetical protein F53441_435 [Fusarium austroafricanum]|uniref:Uncharacterized protein n=1 Tax=Fusarium austroafricanum TaxID=2364996 RepID=A0A8H4KUF2_9HYPO|nr:hypothetical protein F53441_435 [Fusarium austroafricanum]